MTKLPDATIAKMTKLLDGMYGRCDMPFDTYFHHGAIEVHEQDDDGNSLGLVGKFGMVSFEHEWKWVPA